ncbi:MAG: histidine kinase [Cyclobacteriaceae bacterium]
MTFKRKLRRWAIYLGVNLLIATAIVFFLTPRLFFSIEGWRDLVDDILYSFTLCLVLGGGNDFLNAWIGRRVSWIHHPTKRFLLNTIALLTYSFLASLLIAFIFIQLFFANNPSEVPWHVYVETAYLPLGIAVVLTFFITSRGFLLSWRQAAIEAEKLKTERVSSQYETLKNQVNPHFLFNSLNALTSLVYEDQDQAAKFIKKLADVYRYVLDNQQKEVVPLSEEIRFVEAYVFLQKIRFEDNLQVSIQIPADTPAMVLPLSLQMLVENAIKHNIISDDEPLHIQLYLEEDEFMVVKNNLQPKTSHEYSSGLGLKNIRSRYEYLSKKEISVLSSENEFIVKLPLLNLQPA